MWGYNHLYGVVPFFVFALEVKNILSVSPKDIVFVLYCGFISFFVYLFHDL